MSGESIGGVEGNVREAPPVRVDLPGDASAAAHARRALEPLRATLDEARFGDLRLLVSELIADDVRARQGEGQRPLHLEASIASAVLRIELEDHWRVDAPPDERPAPGEAGWGLYLADLLADRWGVESASGGSRFWLELRV